MSILSAQDKAEILSSFTDKDMVLLHCPKHHFFYGQKRQPTPGCKDCILASFVGLLANTPPSRHKEVVEMLEYSVHHIKEAADRGDLKFDTLFDHPHVTIEKDTTL